MNHYLVTFSRRSAPLIRLTKRSQGTSTMGRFTSMGPYGEHNSNIPCSTGGTRQRDRVGFSTAVAYGGLDHDSFQNILMDAHYFAQVRDGNVLGKEMNLKEAAIVSKSGERIFDKIILLVSHGDASPVTEEESRSNFGEKRQGDLALTDHGIGQALKMLGKTGEYCNKSTGLIPELFVTSPIRCATEAALLSFPYYSPESIYGTKWICHGACHDSTMTTPVQHLETSFPNIDYSRAGDHSDFLTWLSTREERVIAISSTPSWVNQFCDEIEPGNDSKDLRVVGIKFTQHL